ncbi:TATA element modulatory factor-like [Uloborus diversus]|uniref:TATA element modulatory factor-like n=1 Tax=Uloborus diversus TaxID=327109 RepID=UPI002409D6B5|nr:TATA element modulatory factor-like [Uloborus diversus]
MSWFDTAGIASFAKSALTTAQKTIDKALDIQDENTKSKKHDVKQPKAFGLSDTASASKPLLQPPVTRNVASDPKTQQIVSDAQASGFWTDTWGSFFEMKTESSSKHDPNAMSNKETNILDNDRKDDCVLSQPHRANVFPDENFLKSNQDYVDVSVCKLKENEILCEQKELQLQNLGEEETLEKESNLAPETLIVTEQPSNEIEPLTLSPNTVSRSSMSSVSDKIPISADKNLVEDSSNCDNAFLSNETNLNSNICVEIIVPKAELNFKETKSLEDSEYLDINLPDILPEIPRKYEVEYDVIESENDVSCNITEDSIYSFANSPSVEGMASESESSMFDINNSTTKIQDMPVNLSESVINWEWGSMDNVKPDVRITDENMNPDMVNNSKSKIDHSLPIMPSDSAFHNRSASSFDKSCAWVQNPKSSHFIDESQNSSNEEQNSHHSDGSSNSSKDDDDTDTAEVKEYDVKSSSSTGSNATSSSSFVKCSGDENDNSHRGQSPVSTTASEKSDVTKHESEQNTSGDENETATSSDIEILSPPNGENGDRNSSPLKHIWLPRPLRFRRSESPTSDSSKDSLMPVVNELEEVSFEERRTGCEKDYQGDNDFQHLLQKQEELQTVLDAREKKILELSKENIELQENEQRLKNLVQKMRTDQAKECRDIAALTKEFTQRLAQVENQLRDAIQERDSLRIQLEEAKIEVSKRMSAADTEEIIKEKDIQIKELIEEGQKLSKKELQHNTIIKKLRAKEEEMDRTIKSQSEKLEENSKEVERLRKSIGAKEEQEKKHIDAIRQLTNSSKKIEKEVASLKSTLEDNTEKELSLKKSLESTYKDYTELKKMYTSKEQELEDLKSGLEIEAKENLRQMLDNANKEAAREKEMLLLQMQELRCALSRADEEANLREKMLKADIASLQKRLQEGEERNEDLTKNMSSATRPLVRQIENLQSSFNTQILSWEKIEKSLTDRLSEAQNQLALMSEKERSAMEKYMEYQSKISVLETQNNSLRQEKLQLSTELESLKAKIIMLEENKDRETYTVSKLKENYNVEIAKLTKEKNNLESTMATCLEQLDLEKKKVMKLEEDLKFKEARALIMSNVSPCPSPTGSVRSSLSSIHNWSQDEAHDQGLNTPVNSYRMSVYDSLRLGSGSSLLENLQSQLKQREGEIMQLQFEINKLEQLKESMTRELVQLSEQNEDLDKRLSKLESVEKEFKDLDQKYNTLLQMYGEKVEETEELQLDLADVKSMYKAQIEELLRSK